MNGDDRAKTHNTPKIEISVRNFGPIAEADLDLRPLTVFVGPSNTGKTYLSVLIYALHRALEDFSEFPILHLLRFLVYGLSTNSVSDSIKSLEILNKRNKGQSIRFSDLSQEVHEQIQFRPEHLKSYDYNLETELKRCFDLNSISELIRHPSVQNGKTTISLTTSKENQNLAHFKMGITESGSSVVDGQINENTIIFPDDWRPPTPQNYFDDIAAFLSKRRRSMEKPYYLPASRSGIIESRQVIASALIARSTRAGSETSEILTFLGGVADFMQELILYRGSARSDDELNHIADTLESDVLAGQIITNPSPTGYPEFLYRPQGTEQDMRLTRSSSMVSELAPLVLFIRGLIRPGDTLIIEEPEAHLHPAAQTEMAATLARLVRAGVRVLVTTHSDYMLQEIGNLMRVGILKEKDALKKETNDWLLPEEVGAWHFQKNQPVKEIGFDHTVGIEPEDYEDVAESLYNRWAGLQNRIEELKDESERECE